MFPNLNKEYRTNRGFSTYSNDHYTILDNIPGYQDGKFKSFRKPIFFRQFSLGFPKKYKFDHPMLFQLKACFVNDQMVKDLKNHHENLKVKIKTLSPFVAVCSNQAILNFNHVIQELGMIEMNYPFLKDLTNFVDLSKNNHPQVINDNSFADSETNNQNPTND